MIIFIIKVMVGISLVLGAMQIFKDWKIWRCAIKTGLEESPLKTLLIMAAVIVVLVLIIRWFF